MSLTYLMDNRRHLVCIPYSVDNLHEMAADLGIKRHWFHSKAKLPHYDVPVNRINSLKTDPRVINVSPKIIIGVCSGRITSL